MSGPLNRNLLAVRVTPKASRNEVTGLYTAADGTVSLSVNVTAAPDKGKANRRLPLFWLKKLAWQNQRLPLSKARQIAIRLFNSPDHSNP